MKKLLYFTLIAFLSFSFFAVQEAVAAKAMKVPNSVTNISKENTYPNASQDQPRLQPSELAKELLETSDTAIENPHLIKMLNESSISGTPLAIGYRATIYLGRWALSYNSNETVANWEYQKINMNRYDNRSGKSTAEITYSQEKTSKIKGGLTAKVPKAEDVKNMMMLKAMEKTKLPLAFETVVGAGTKRDQTYKVSPKKLGVLNAFAPAINEKGKITYGEVYLVLKGNKRKLVVKNITSQGIGAWIPVQDHLTMGFKLNQSR
ncbi:YfkD famly protein [Bacillus changyiensis]|uniref:YfkD famly protein n=1 Tax=Bacillus changyiensis TaxID=3004103 RepID=UPI0022E4F720|nr:YfkD famly protein [Bacillus changyiensis]MDA1477218.1 YfkD family protein [Bacillus changyiensis]